MLLRYRTGRGLGVREPTLGPATKMLLPAQSWYVPTPASAMLHVAASRGRQEPAAPREHLLARSKLPMRTRRASLGWRRPMKEAGPHA